MASAALMLAALSSHDQALSPKWNDRLDGAAPLGLFCFAVTLPIPGPNGPVCSWRLPCAEADRSCCTVLPKRRIGSGSAGIAPD